MNAELLDAAKEYVETEVQRCEEVIDQFDSDTSVRDRLKRLYGARTDRVSVYCESGDLDRNLGILGPDKEFVFPVFPYRRKERLEEDVAPLPRLIEEAIESRRLLPVIQHPEYYVDLPHFERLLTEVHPPSYFVRRQYAYAILLDIEPDMVEGSLGTPLLRKIHKFKGECLKKHEELIDRAVDADACWEHRWKRQKRRDTEFYDRLRESLAYRYASVSLCIGQKAVDEILDIYDTVTAWRILLYLHILFDHVIAHGFGSDYAVSPITDEGLDFYRVRETVSGKLRRRVAKIALKLPAEIGPYAGQLIEDEHFLIDFDLDEVNENNIHDIKVDLVERVREYRKRIEKVEESEEMIGVILTISFLATGAYQLAINQIPEGLFTVFTGDDKRTKIPSWISKQIVNGLNNLQKRSLGTYIIERVTP